jgi:pyruvate dehydrogenase (quinone)
LAEQLKVPIVHAMRGKEHVKWDNAYDIDMTGLIGFWSGYYAMVDCDVVLTDSLYRQFYPRRAGVCIAQVDLRAENIGRGAPVDPGLVGGLVGDLRATVAAGCRATASSRKGTATPCFSRGKQFPARA